MLSVSLSSSGAKELDTEADFLTGRAKVPQLSLTSSEGLEQISGVGNL